jgi:molybdate transport system regulatory protein
MLTILSEPPLSFAPPLSREAFRRAISVYIVEYTGWPDHGCHWRSDLLPCGMTRLVLQLHFDAENRIGPGKIELLEQIDQTGSISSAGRAMKMSYRRAWLLVDAMNRTFHAPLVATRFGGSSTGRAKLTPLGQEVMRLYQEIGQVARDASHSRIARLEQLITEGVTSAASENASASTPLSGDASFRTQDPAASAAEPIPPARS